jgi:hypothetical protein
MYNRKIAPTVSKIKKEIEDTIKISFPEGIFGASEPSTGNDM